MLEGVVVLVAFLVLVAFEVGGIELDELAFRMCSGRGESIIVMFRPALRGSMSTCAMVARSSFTFSMRSHSDLLVAICRPRNINCTRSLSPCPRKCSARVILIS